MSDAFGLPTNGHDSTKVDQTQISNSFPMTNDTTLVASEWAAMAADTAVLTVANSKTTNREYVNGIAQNGTAQTGDMVVWTETCTTAGGSITSYCTTQGATRTSGGTPLLSTLFPDTIQTNFIDSSGVYAQGAPSITSNKTSVIGFTKQGFTGVSILGLNVLGAAAMATIPDGVTVKLMFRGIAA